jgi:hypothetical protein
MCDNIGYWKWRMRQVTVVRKAMSKRWVLTQSDEVKMPCEQLGSYSRQSGDD